MYMVRRSRTPQGVRGLKLQGGVSGNNCVASHSARSAWIETLGKVEEVDREIVALRKECVD